MSGTDKKTNLPKVERNGFKVIENPEQRASLYDPVKQGILRVLNEGHKDFASEVKREQRTLDDGTRITEETKVEKPIQRYWMTVPEILLALRTTNPNLTLATSQTYYHLGKLHEQGLLEQFPKVASASKTRVRGRYFRAAATFFVEVTVEASVGYSGSEVMPKEIEPRFVELADGVRQTGVAASMEYQVDLDGILLWVSMTMSRHSDGLNIVAVVRDITTHRTLEERLEKSEIEFGRLVEESFQGYAIFQEGVPVFINPAYAKTVGRTQSELNLMTPDDTKMMVHPDDRHILEERNKELSRGMNALPRQHFRYIRPDGTTRWVESFARKTEHLGRPALLSIEIDITERIEAELELQESEKRNRIIADSMSDLVLVFDSEDQYCEYFGDSSLLVEPWDEMRGKKQRDLLTQDFPEIHESYSRKVRETGESITYEIELEIQGSVKWLQSTMMLHEDKESIVVAVKDISERKAAEESVKRSERRFREIFDSSPVAIGRCNREGVFVELNQTFLDLFGISSTDDAPGYRLNKDPHVPKWALNKVAEGEFVTFDVTYDFELIQNRKMYKSSRKGTVDLIAALTPLNLPENSSEAGYLIMVQDVTERLRAEEALRDSEERYRAFFEQAGDSIIISDPLSSEIVDFNRHAHESLGYTEDEFRNLKLWELDASEDKADVEGRTMEIAEKGNLVYETKHKSKNGDVKNVRVSARVVTFRDRMINQAIMTDITEEKKAESRLKASEEKYKSLFESSVDAIVLVKDGKLVDLNPSALKIFGYEREDIIDKTPWAVSPRRQPDGSLSKESALDRINRVLAGEPQLFTWRHRRFDGTEFDTFVGLSAVKYDGEEMIQAVIRLEISEHFRLLGGFTQ